MPTLAQIGSRNGNIESIGIAGVLSYCEVDFFPLTFLISFYDNKFSFKARQALTTMHLR